ncbi:MAG: purine-binding chemotaxis protein CheW [Gammaproteobacteria bacterium]|nr:purine-binding chemotaxis protein CheW [Gammaproteobacteria bacterium]
MDLDQTLPEVELEDRSELEMLLDRRRQAGARIVEVDTAKVKLVLFMVGETLLAFPARVLTEILSSTTIHFVPGCPPALEGVIDVRGDIASVVRLGDLLGLTHAHPDRRSAILLGRGTQVRSGMRVDRVLDVLDVPEESIHTPPDSLPEPLRESATGVFEHRGQATILLDLDRVFLTLLPEQGRLR